jgi:hypothetical protein
MAKKLFIKLQTPTIELPIEAIGLNGESIKSFVGLKYYNISEAEKKIEELKNLQFGEEFQNLLKEFETVNLEKKALEESGQDSLDEKVLLEKASEIYKKITSLDEKFSEIKKTSQKAVEDFIKKEIAYLREIPFEVYDEVEGELKFLETYVVKDTRNEPSGDFWKDEKECLSVCIEKAFASKSWKEKLIELFQSTILNVEAGKEAEVKN